MLVAIALLTTAIAVQAQTQAHFGIKGGLNMATLRGNALDDSDSRNGLAIGAFAILEMPRGFALQPEILFTQWGAKLQPAALGDEFQWEYRFNYIAIDLLARFKFDLNGPVAPVVFVGPSLAINTSSNLKFEHEGEVDEYDIGNVKNTDLGLVLGGGTEIDLKKVLVTLEVRYTLGAEGFLEDGTYIANPTDGEVYLVDLDGQAWDSKHGALSILIGVAL